MNLFFFVILADSKEESSGKSEKKPIDIGKEAAMEAEVRAARERAIVPLDTRIKSFREMLAEKEVRLFSVTYLLQLEFEIQFP